MRGLLALLIALTLGCGRRSSTDAALEFWAMGREGEVVAQMMPDFERRHPGVRVHVQQLPWSAAHEKLLTAYVGGAMPDVFQAGNTWLPELVALGAIAPLDQRIAGSAAVVRDDYFPGILDTNVLDGVSYGVPWYVDTRLLFYRADLLAQVGFPAPPRTWATWMDAMVRLKERGSPDRYAVLLPIREWQVPVILALQRGAGLLRDGDRYGDFRNPAVRTGFAYYLNLFRRGLAPRTGEAAVGNVYQEFANGFFAFYVTGPWNLGEFARRLPPALVGQWATTPMPAPDGEGIGVSLAGGASLVLSAGSRHADAAWQLVEYLSEAAQQVRFHELTGDLPARRAAWREAALETDAHAHAFWLQLQSVRSTPKIPEWERIATKITQYVEAGIREEMTIDAALTALDRDVDDVLAKRRLLLGGGS